MADVFSKEKRSEVMRAIKPVGTKPEQVVRTVLKGRGLGSHVRAANLPGRPDIVLPALRLAIFVHGCFWHQHKNCSVSRIPSTNRPYWVRKFESNRRRDCRVTGQLRRLGWSVSVVWECETRSRPKVEALTRKLVAKLDRRKKELKGGDKGWARARPLGKLK